MAPARASLLGSAVRSRAWLLVLLIAQPAISSRLGALDLTADLGPNDLQLEGVAHKTLKMFESWGTSDEKLTDSIPGDLFAMLKKNELIQEYKSLASQVGMSGRGRFGNWKASEVYRTMYIGGHEDAFHAKGVSIYLCKGVSSGLGMRSPLKLYFVDRALQPTYMPPDIYADAKSVITKTSTDHILKSKGMPEGVLASSFDDEQIVSDKLSMPVDILKLLEAKDALEMYMNFAAEVKVKGHTWFQALVTAYGYQEQFRAKGLGVFFCLSPKNKHNVVRHTWFEYVDLDVAPSYVPQEQYRTDVMPAYQMCMKGNASTFYSLAAEDAIKKARLVNDVYACGSLVIGAEDRRENGDIEEVRSCKCPRYDDALFCGSQQIDDRKFSLSHVHSRCGALAGNFCWSLPKKDRHENSCSWYKGTYKRFCGRYDTISFRADKDCCYCGGGLHTKKATKENVAYCARKACLPLDA